MKSLIIRWPSRRLPAALLQRKHVHVHLPLRAHGAVQLSPPLLDERKARGRGGRQHVPRHPVAGEAVARLDAEHGAHVRPRLERTFEFENTLAEMVSSEKVYETIGIKLRPAGDEQGGPVARSKSRRRPRRKPSRRSSATRRSASPM